MTETLIPQWVETPQAGFVVGDRIRFTCESTEAVVEGTVRSITYTLCVERDDGRSGGGEAFAGRYTWCVTENGNGPLFKLSDLPEGYEPPARAVFCLVCGNATGEITNTAPTSKFCVQCRALPALYDYDGEPTGGLVNTDDGRGRTLADPPRVAERMRATGAGQYGDAPTPTFTTTHAYAAAPPTTLTDYFVATDEDEPEPHDPLVCTSCGENAFEMRGLQWDCPDVPEAPTTYTDEDYEAGGTLFFEYPYTPEPDLDQYRARVICSGCGAEHHGDWEWA